MVRRLKSEVLKDLPPKSRAVVPLQLSDRKQYDFAMDDFPAWLAETHNKRLPSDSLPLVKWGYDGKPF